MIFKVRIRKKLKGFVKGKEYPVLHVMNENVEHMKRIEKKQKEDKHQDYDDEEYLDEQEENNIEYFSASILWLLVPNEKNILNWVDSTNVRYVDSN